MTTQGLSPTAIADGSGDHSEGESVICPQCRMGGLTIRHCKSICERCGYVESCEDNFALSTANPEDESARLNERTVTR